MSAGGVPLTPRWLRSLSAMLLGWILLFSLAGSVAEGLARRASVLVLLVHG